MIYNKTISAEQAFQKIKYYCNYQERSHYEVKEKLYSFKLYKKDVEEILSKLIEENLLNEARFAATFARGKFSLKKWGKIKIAYELKNKQVSEYNIRAALVQIDQQKYMQTLQQLASTKWKALKSEQYINRQIKTTRYLLQKGYENKFIQDVLKAMRAAQ